jgi:enediyne biosynthesis protein E4
LIGGGRAYGRPQSFPGTFPYLYRNDGGGSFSEVAAAAGLQVRDRLTGERLAKSLGVTFADLDHDGWIDILVANDTVQNFLFHNQRDGTFNEVGAVSGLAFDVDGNARGAMGIDVAQFRNDDSLGVAIGNFSDEMTALYVTRGTHLSFVDEAVANGLGQRTREQLTFGVFYFDADLDGRLDLFATNGHLENEIHRVRPDQHYEQSPQLFWNRGKSGNPEFVLLTSQECGEDLRRPAVGRGAAYADVDGDGDVDLLMTTAGGSPRLLRNDQQRGHHWLRVRLRGTVSNADAIGAWVEVEVSGMVLRQQVMPTRSYASQVELPLTFGLRGADRIDRLTVSWPDGSTQRIAPPAVDQQIEIEQEL